MRGLYGGAQEGTPVAYRGQLLWCLDQKTSTVQCKRARAGRLKDNDSQCEGQAWAMMSHLAP